MSTVYLYRDLFIYLFFEIDPYYMLTHLSQVKASERYMAIFFSCSVFHCKSVLPVEQTTAVFAPNRIRMVEWRLHKH